jgi:hypothetical protein
MPLLMPMEGSAGGWIEGDRDDRGIETTWAWRQCDCAADRAGPQDGAETSRSGSLRCQSRVLISTES